VTQPLVSIIIPTYNRAHLIGETLDSVLAQTYTNWECIVVDDGSTDHTSEVLKIYCDKEARIKYFHRPDTHKPGGNGARNYGFEVSKGGYVNWLDSDDVFGPTKIACQLELIIDKPLAVATCKWARFSLSIDSIGKKENEPYYHSYNNALNLFNDFGINGGFFPSHAYLVSRDIICKSGLWDTSLITNQDGEFFCRALIASRHIIFYNHTLVYYRHASGDNISQVNSLEKAENRIYSWKLIDSHIEKAYGVRESKYVKSAKHAVYLNISKKYPELIRKYRFYFRVQIFKSTLFYRILLKIKMI
jgi:glycosyltransferase involved in cell wall biosynthesis